MRLQETSKMNLCLGNAINTLAGQHIITCSYDMLLLEGSTKKRAYMAQIMSNVRAGG